MKEVQGTPSGRNGELVAKGFGLTHHLGEVQRRYFKDTAGKVLLK
jgi:hypothetical protein